MNTVSRVIYGRSPNHNLSQFWLQQTLVYNLLFDGAAPWQVGLCPPTSSLASPPYLMLANQSPMYAHEYRQRIAADCACCACSQICDPKSVITCCPCLSNRCRCLGIQHQSSSTGAALELMTGAGAVKGSPSCVMGLPLLQMRSPSTRAPPLPSMTMGVPLWGVPFFP